MESQDHLWACFDAPKVVVISNLAKDLPYKIMFLEVMFEMCFKLKIDFFTYGA